MLNPVFDQGYLAMAYFMARTPSWTSIPASRDIRPGSALNVNKIRLLYFIYAHGYHLLLDRTHNAIHPIEPDNFHRLLLSLGSI